VRRLHLDALGPVCPACRTARGSSPPLRLTVETTADASAVWEGLLQCPAAECLQEYPIIDGIPILVPDVRGYLAAQSSQLRGRSDLSPVIEGLLVEAAGPGSALDATWTQISSYGWDHYGEWDRTAPADAAGDRTAGSIVRVLDTALELVRDAGRTIGDGPVIDLGTGPGRAALELAGRCAGPVIGTDLGPHLLGLGAQVARTGRVRFPLRRGGLRYDWREFAVPLPGAARTDFWIADAVRLPFGSETFAAAVALNLLDCVYAPLDLLAEIARVVRPGGLVVLASPYDWTGAATPVEAWIGGHSPRGFEAGSSSALLRRLLTPGDHPAALAGFRLLAESAAVPWQVRMHDRSTVAYRLHLIVAERTESIGPVRAG
jgi:SAM-dependent methyltransferase/uncharacterized protein YbaR (Trm112 family)